MILSIKANYKLHIYVVIGHISEILDLTSLWTHFLAYGEVGGRGARRGGEVGRVGNKC